MIFIGISDAGDYLHVENPHVFNKRVFTSISFFHILRFMARKYDDFDEQDQDGLFDQIFTIISRRKREFAIVSVSAAMILLGLVVWGSYPRDRETAESESVPIVRADAGEYKVVPDNPGGMEIPYRDSTVFSSAEGPKSETTTENILADDSTEQPLPKEQLFAGLNTDAKQPDGEDHDGDIVAVVPQQPADVETAEPPSNASLVQEAIGVSSVPPVPSSGNAETMKTAAATPPAEAVKPIVVEEEKTESPPKVEIIQKADKADVADKAAKIESAAGAATPSKTVQAGGYYVQLASVKSLDGAGTEWKKLQTKYSSLSAMKYRAQEANLGAKGVFYRIQAGPMSKDSASTICNNIKAGGGACFVVAK